MPTIADEAARWCGARVGAVLHVLGGLPVDAPTIAEVCAMPHRDGAPAAYRCAVREFTGRVPEWTRDVPRDTARCLGAVDRLCA